ncbi:putative deoxyribonuclease RhsB [Allorhodopirellula solitaria]|uniref:Putative deoxyribonuclease RhsB n=2 Tax=Allorhodopirellula solitaria TaxID=2527987 RepID=A0A5C5YJV0_9BACT|nr:putative deoxyribonuclease RhsB [Allorhodopirellula solitaria]
MDYDGAGRLSSLTHGASEIASGENWNGTSTLPASLGNSDLLAAYTYQYDADNRLTQFSTYRDGTSTAYGYDVRDQLTSAASTAISGLSQPFGLASAESYDFDAGGNRKSSGGASQSAANTHNQLQTDGTYNYTYDDEGNTLSRILISTGAVTLYEWDHRNRLESITEKTSAVGSVTQKIEYIYDALDQRVGKRLDSDGDGDFDRDEVFLWTEGQTALRATDSDGEAATESFTLASRYLYGEMVDQLLADEQYNGGTGPDFSATTASATAGDTYWALTDHLGSVRDLVDNNGEIRQHVAYDSFGNRIVEQDYDASGSTISSSHADAIDELFGYTGRDWDADAGLQNNRARWYDPATGRWLSNDPIGFAAGDANLYRYVGNGPTTKTDPSGLQPPKPKKPDEVEQENDDVNVWPYTGTPGGKKKAQQTLGIPPVKVVPYPGYRRTHGVPQGKNSHFSNIPFGHYVGTTGAGPCVGLIIVSPGDKTPGGGMRDIWVYHFEADDHPNNSIDLHDLPTGSEGIIFGGDDRTESSPALIDAIIADLKARGIKIRGLYNSPGMWADRHGTCYVFNTERETATKDGTLPKQQSRRD